MRILFDHQMFAIQRQGGITRIFIELMRQLSYHSKCGVYWHRGLHIDNYNIKDFRRGLSGYWGIQTKTLQHRKELVQRFNNYSFKIFTSLYYNTNTVYHPTYYDSDLLSIVKPSKLAITIHDMIPELFLSSAKEYPQFQKLIKDKKQFIERADLIFVNSLNTQNDLLRLTGVDPAKLCLTYWATNIDEIREVMPLPDFIRKPFFIFIGTRSKYKNFALLMKAFSINERLKSNFDVVSFGGTSDFVKPEKQFLEDNRLINNFYYLNGNDVLLKMLYQHAVALVYPSRYEGFGLPPLEAMTCGCPVICCHHSSLPEIVGENALFIDPDEPDQLAYCLLKVSEDHTLRESLIKNGLARVKLFSWEKTSSRTLEGYRSIV